MNVKLPPSFACFVPEGLIFPLGPAEELIGIFVPPFLASAVDIAKLKTSELARTKWIMGVFISGRGADCCGLTRGSSRSILEQLVEQKLALA